MSTSITGSARGLELELEPSTRMATIPTPSAYHPANFPENLYSWSQRVSERKQPDEDSRRMPQAEFVGLALRTFNSILQPLHGKDARDEPFLERAKALHKAMVSRDMSTQRLVNHHVDE
jgi:hypothetical protein